MEPFIYKSSTPRVAKLSPEIDYPIKLSSFAADNAQ